MVHSQAEILRYTTVPDKLTILRSCQNWVYPHVYQVLIQITYFSGKGGSDFYNTSKAVCLVEDFEIDPKVFFLQVCNRIGLKSSVENRSFNWALC